MAVSLDNRAKVAGTSFLLFCLALFLTAYSARQPRIANIGTSVVGEVLRPAQLVNRWLIGGVDGILTSYVNLVGVKRENDELKEKLRSLQERNSYLMELESENKRLSSLIDVQRDTGLKVVAANVIGYEASSWVNGITLDRGQSDGIRRGMAVVERNGLVGQVIAVSANSSRVLLITDPASGVDGIVQASRARGVVEGSGGSRCRWRFVLREDEVKVGDRVITSGMDGVFPKGLLIGIVAEIETKKNGLFQSMDIEPTVDFSRLESVLVVSDPIRFAESEKPLREAHTAEKPAPRKKAP